MWGGWRETLGGMGHFCRIGLTVSLVASLAVVSVGVLGIGLPSAAQEPADPTAPSAMGARQAPAEAPRRSAQEEARRARVYARIGEATVTVGDIEDTLASQSPFMRVRYRDPAKLRELADSLVRFELLAREAEKKGYGDSAAVAQQIDQAMVQRLFEREFDQRITRESITDAEVSEYYQAHLAEFARPAMVRASHILLPTREAAEALREEVAQADPREFRTLARQHSIDTETKLRGGDLRYFTHSGRPPNASEEDPPVDEVLVKTAFGLENRGDVSEPVQVGEAWSLVKLTGERAEETRELDRAAEGIRLKLWRERRQEAIEEFVRKLRAQATVETHPERMRPIQLAPVEPTKDLPAEGGGHGRAEKRRHGARAPGSAPAPQAPAAGTMEAVE